MAADGEKLSKRKKNYAPMDTVFDEYGVDTLRYFLASSPLMNGEAARFSTDHLRDVQRNVFMSLNNIYSFFKLYADVDGWKPDKPLEEPQSTNILDQWAIARLNQTITEVTKAMDSYRLDKASRPIAELLDDISNWYVRRSRRRFWKAEDDNDKQQAYATLHYLLLRTSQILAPFSPFLPDYIWRRLVEGTSLPVSVHLSDWPSVNQPDNASRKVLIDMAYARGAVATGLAARAEAGIRVRQPLASAVITNAIIDDSNREAYEQIIQDELNVKKVDIEREGDLTQQRSQPPRSDEWLKAQVGGLVKVRLDTNITPELKTEGISRELVRHIQSARKKAGLNVEDRIQLMVKSDNPEVIEALEKHKDLIYAETLATSQLNSSEEAVYREDAKLDGHDLSIGLKKA
jgi:isoleucyl-tRNA synthetase